MGIDIIGGHLRNDDRRQCFDFPSGKRNTNAVWLVGYARHLVEYAASWTGWLRGMGEGDDRRQDDLIPSASTTDRALVRIFGL